MTYTTLALCQSKGGFEAIPNPKLRLDLADARRKLEAAGISVTDARVLLIAAMEREVTLSRDGRVLIKSQSSAEAARVFAKLRDLVGLPGLTAPTGSG